MSKRLYFNAFHMNCVVHQSPGLWLHPDNQTDRYTDLDAWTDLAGGACFNDARVQIELLARH